MAIADFRPTLGKFELNTSGSIQTGNNAAFCAKFLDKRVGGAPVSLEALTYVLPSRDREGGGQGERPSVVVNLLMQLRASCDQNNFFLRTGQAAQAQVTARLHQALGQCSGAARARAGEIERAIRTRLVQDEEFSRALRKLERELKKNSVSLNQPLPEKETGRWSGSPFRQEKGRTARPEGPRNFLRIQMHRSELLRSIGMRQEKRATRRTASRPDAASQAEERVFFQVLPPWGARSEEGLAYFQKESGAVVLEPSQGQEKEISRSAGKRRKGGKSPEKRREPQTAQPPETERAVQFVPVFRKEQLPGGNVRWIWRQTLEKSGPEICRQLIKRSGPEIYWRILEQTAGEPPRRELLPNAAKSRFQQAFLQRVQENDPSALAQSGLQSFCFKLPEVSQKIWRQALRWAYAPVNWQMLRSIPAARTLPAGKDGAVRFVPMLRREQLPGELGRTIFSVREAWTYSNNISLLDRERPVREHTAEKYTAQDSPPPEARLLSQPVRAERYIYRDSVYRPPEAPGGGVRWIWRQMLEKDGPEIYRQPLKRGGSEIYRREVFRSFPERFQQIFLQSAPRDSRLAQLQSAPQNAWLVLPQISREVWQQILRRVYISASKEILQDAPHVRIIPPGGNGAVRFVPVLRREQLPGETGKTIVTVRGTRTHSNSSFILDRERPVQEHIAKEYTTEKYTAQDSQPSEVRLPSQSAAAGRYRYLTFPRSASVPGGRAGRLRQRRLERNIPELYRQGQVRSGGAKLILRRVLDWAKELVRGPVEQTAPGRNISSGTRPEPPFSKEPELRYTKSVEKRREQEHAEAILTRPGERTGEGRVPLWRMLRAAESRAAPGQWKTEEFVRETWSRNHILYRVLRQKGETEAGGPKTLLYTERGEKGKSRDFASGVRRPAVSQGLTHFAQPLEMAEGTLSPLPAYRAPERERTEGKHSVPERTGTPYLHLEAEKAEGERDSERHVQSILAPERTEDRPVIVYRSPARPASPAGQPPAAPAVPGQLEGEDVFRAQTVSSGQVRAMEQAFSYQAPGSRREKGGQSVAESAYAPRAEKQINYNRLTEEILIRLERRLRAERRKFGL